MRNASDENDVNLSDGGAGDSGDQQQQQQQESAGGSYIGAGSGGIGEGDDGLIVSESKPGVSRGTLVMFAILVVGAVGLYVMYRQTGPKSASAASTTETAEAKKTINTFLSGGDSSIKTMQALIKNTEKVVQQFLQYPSVRQVPLGDLRTNPFRQRLENPTKQQDASDASDKKRREEERLAIYKAVQGLQLQSIMYSDARTACMINNTLYRDGQTVEGFTIEKITPAAVVVRNGSYRFELKMQK
jgi:hypothetical protein